jgi:phosphoribosylanthranilate isomerase
VVRALPAVNRPIVKLCGLRSPADVLAAYAADADMLGIVLVPGKRRTVDIPTAREMVSTLPADALTVGLFLAHSDEDLATIADMVAQSGVSIAQVHGDIPLGAFADFPVPVIRANMSYDRCLPAIMQERALPQMDSAPPGEWGGTGEVGDWQQAAKAASEFPILLAGGLTPQNVAAAIKTAQPWGVDVSSGIENEAGDKDPARMRAFVQAATSALSLE